MRGADADAEALEAGKKRVRCGGATVTDERQS